MTSLELKQNISSLGEHCIEILNNAKSENRALTESEKTEVNNIITQIEENKEQLKTIQNKLKNTKISNIREMKHYYLAEAILSGLGRSEMTDEAKTLFEGAKETFNEAKLEIGKEPNTFCVPFNYMTEAAEDLTGPTTGNELNATLTNNQGKSTIHTEYDPILAPVFNQTILGLFDVKTGIRGNLEIPRYGGASAYWKGELKKAGETTMKFDAVEAKPKRLTTYIVLSRQLLEQSAYNIESYVREELINAISRKLQTTMLGDGAGDNDTPTGLFYQADTLNELSFASLVNIEKAAKKNNVTGNLAYIINPDIEATLRTTLKSNVAGAQYLMEDGKILGQTTIVSNDAKGILFGDLKQIYVPVWGNGIVMSFNPYSLDQYDALRITVHFYVDFLNRAPLTGEGTSAAPIKNIFAYTLAEANNNVQGETGQGATGQGATGQGE